MAGIFTKKTHQATLVSRDVMMCSWSVSEETTIREKGLS